MNYSITVRKPHTRTITKVFSDFTQARLCAIDLLKAKKKDKESIMRFKEKQFISLDNTLIHQISMSVWYNHTDRKGFSMTRGKVYSVEIVGYVEEYLKNDPALWENR